MPQIIVHDPAGLHHGPAGFSAWGPGEYVFPDDAAYAGWLQGHVDAGRVSLANAVTVKPTENEVHPQEEIIKAPAVEPAPDLPDGLQVGSPDKVAVQTGGESAIAHQRTTASAAEVVENLPHAPRKGKR